MDLWPPSRSLASKNKNKDDRAIPVVGLGSNIVTLSQRNGRLDWTSVVADCLTPPEWERVKLRVGKPVLCFPRTRPPPLQIPATSVHQRAEQGANFLRTHLPEVDISAEIIRDEIALDEGVSLRDQDFNPFQGNLLEHISVGVDGDRKSTYLIFPTGENNKELNLSPLSYSPADSPTFKPSSKPKLVFSSPIQQLSALDDSDSSFLAIRTFGPTNFLQVKHTGATEHQSNVQLLELGHIDRTFTGNNLIVDVKASRPGEYVLASTTGTVYNCSFANAKANVTLIHTPEAAQDDFWRVVPLPHSEAVLLISKNHFEWLDTRSRTSTIMHSSSSKRQAITSAASLATPHLLSVCTTENILWIDRRKPEHPLLAYKHGRQRDRTLRLDRFPSNTGHLFLSSQKNDLITIYDIETADTNHISLRTSPYCLPAVNGYNSVYTGRTILSYSTNKLNATMFSLSEWGSLHALDVQDPELDVKEYFPTIVEWSEEVKTLHLKSGGLLADTGPRGSQQVMRVDLTGAYDRAFRQHFKAAAEAEEQNAESVYDLLEQLPTFWQSNSTPIEHMLTTYDIAFATGDEPEAASRADFLTGSVVNSHRGYRALMQGRLSSRGIRKNAPWHYDLRGTIERLDLETLGDHVEFENSLHQYDLLKDDGRSVASIKLESDAREQLVLDMALASDVYSAHPFTKVGVDDELNALTEALSLGEDIPPVTFRYLRPVNHSHNPGEDEEEKQSGVLTTSLGARLLLKEWEVGTDPNDYVYRDPYGDAEPQGPYPAPQVPQRERLTQVAQSQRPPMVIATASLQPPAIIPEPKKLASHSQGSLPPIRAAHSQGSLMNTQTPASQNLMASTQVLPGPFGGRPAPGKKAAKKRVGVVQSHEAGLLDSPASVLYGWKKAINFSSLNFLRTSSSILYDPVALHETLRRNKAVVCALSASYVSTFAGYPLDSLKSRLQTTKTPITIPRLAAIVYREEGIVGFYRGIWIPLITISFVRAASFTIYSRTRETFRNNHWLTRDSALDAALVGGISGAMSGALISFASAQYASRIIYLYSLLAFELVKVRRQLEYSIAASKGVTLKKPPGTLQAVREIFRSNGFPGLYTGFRLHFLRDTSGTMLYFLEYDGLRHLLGRTRSGEQGPTPSWLPIPESVVPFVCGSFSGVTSWALIYPLDVVKTKIQQRALAGERYRGVWETFHRLIRGPDPQAPKPLLAGVARIYRGLGVSAVRSITTHGLLWTLFDAVANYIDNLPSPPQEGKS
ncbi:hypothetical protein BDN72DRAFT_873880 [Pluteus cervinus]|uniref:Uncharacterized protein n=1 Tax=Pluteus cervinus TaxID=181527 RepID=A0ACD3BF67_9AGAR|nr:hypothetical protein BDN72DRAFT_873880 [Pluteus cervinus]